MLSVGWFPESLLWKTRQSHELFEKFEAYLVICWSSSRFCTTHELLYVLWCDCPWPAVLWDLKRLTPPISGLLREFPVFNGFIHLNKLTVYCVECHWGHKVFVWHYDALSQQIRVELFLPESDKYTAAVASSHLACLAVFRDLIKYIGTSVLLNISDWSYKAADCSDMLGCITARSPLAWLCGMHWKLLPWHEYVLPQWIFVCEC